MDVVVLSQTKWSDIAVNVGYDPTWNDYIGLDFPSETGNFVLLLTTASTVGGHVEVLLLGGICTV